MSTSADDTDRIIDQSTQAAIQCADKDYLRWAQGESLKQLAAVQFAEARATTLADVSESALEFYTGIFMAAYRRRSHTLSSFPVAKHQDTTL